MRLYVERKPQYNTKAAKLEREAKGYLEVDQLEKVRSITGFEILGLTKEQLEQVKYRVFAQEGMDDIYETINLDGNYNYITRYLDHQYDQSADLCETLIKLQFPKADVRVKTLDITMLYGDLGQGGEKIKNYYVNPLESEEVSLDQPFNWKYGTEEPKPVMTIKGFSDFNEKQLEDMKSQYGISMNSEDLAFTQAYFKKEEKDPTLTELKILDTYWSDHCRHSTFQTVLEKVNIEDEKNQPWIKKAQDRFEAAHQYVYEGERPLCLMDMATMEMKKLKKQGILTNMEDTVEVNACSIEVKGKVDGKEEDFLIMFKNETHNHPTEMEPFGGAGTCIGGGIRDPLSGRSYVFGAMRLTGAADPRETVENTLEDKIPQRNITTTAANGYSDYANQIGLASGYLDEFYHEGFKAKRMECGALVAYNYKKNITRANPEPGDIIVMMGGDTGRDGLGGAVGSSKEVEGDSKSYSAEVQKGNPIVERNIVRLFRKPEISKLIKKSNDFGAGGVSVAIGEMADSLSIDLDQVPLKYPGMNGTEVAISESQERMAILLDPKDLDTFMKAAQAENVKAVKVATVTDTDTMVMTYQGQVICDLKADFLNSGGVRQKASVKVQTPKLTEKPKEKEETKGAWLENLSKLNVCSKKNIASQFDKAVGGQSVLYPFGGKHMETPEQGLAMRLPLEEGKTDLGTVMTAGYNPDMGPKSPFHGAYYAVIESVMKAVSMGADLADIRLTFQEYFERMTSDETWGKVYSALLGAFLAQDILQIPSIGGKDSMSGSYKDIDVPPTLISFAVAPVDCTKLISKPFKKSGSKVYLLETKIGEDYLPEEEALLKNIQHLAELIKSGKILSTSVVGAGGIAAEISRMAFGNKIGFKFDEGFEGDLFKENYSAVIIEASEELDLKLLGTTAADQLIEIKDTKIELEEALKSYKKPLEEVFECEYYRPEIIKAGAKISLTPQNKKTDKPLALIPIFGGSNGEYTLERQLKIAGFEVKTVLFRSMFMKESYKELVEAIKEADLLALPSGMSGGGKPNSPAKFISIVLSQEEVKKAINELLDRKGLVTGLGEGFKALVDLGLIQHGRIKEKTDSLQMAPNPMNKNYAGLFKTSIISPVEPYYRGATSEILPVSTIFGRIEMDQEDFERYNSKGQIVSVFDGANPYGSRYGIEAMVSENGQVFGKLGEISQLEEGLYANVFEAKTSPVFKNLKEYFVK